MPKTKKRSVKSRKRKRRKRTYDGDTKKQWSSRGKVVPFYHSIRTPMTKDQTISYIVINDNQYDVSRNPGLTGVINSYYGNLNLQQLFEGNAVPTLNVFPAFRKLREVFEWTRIEWIRVTFTPMNYEGAGVAVGDPNHPIFQVVSDNGTSAIGLGNPSSILTDVARGLPKQAYSQYYFNKPIEFYINPVEKLGLEKGQNPYSTMNRWCPPHASNPLLDGTDFIPNDSFYHGFVEAPTNFTYKIKVEAKIVCKQFKIPQVN